MASLNYKIRGSGSPQGKPRVYFCCHLDDFDRYFEEISEDILSRQTCAVWYRGDFSAFDDELENDLKQMQLFVIPVTAKFLTAVNDAFDIEFRIAIENHIPVLPLMQEPGLEQLFNLKCGNLQFLNKYSNDMTEISYDEKLKKYLESVLIGNELAEKIRAAFDAYVFLSYRKKDRKYAQELMKLIHKNKFCRDIAIWYDEFLTPGENFNDSIKEALLKSDLFVLTVTPNLVNELNYIVTTEYPMAKAENKPVFPVELVPTDKDELFSKFDGISAPTDAHDDGIFTDALLENIKKLAIKENNSSPEHNFFIGLAYLNGIDVEVDRERAVKLITYAAENGLEEAMVKLYDMYKNGDGVKLDYEKSVYWAEKLYEYRRINYGEEHPDTLASLNNLAFAYGNAGNYEKQLGLNEKCYEVCKKVLGEEHPGTLSSMNNLASTYGNAGNYQKELEINEKCYELRKKVLGEEHPDALTSLNNLAGAYYSIGNYQKAIELNEKSYELHKKILGEEYPDTLTSLNNIASTYGDIGNYEKQLELNEKCYELRKKVLGEEHPDTLIVLSNLAGTYGNMGSYEKKLELNEKCYELSKKVLGE